MRVFQPLALLIAVLPAWSAVPAQAQYRSPAPRYYGSPLLQSSPGKGGAATVSAGPGAWESYATYRNTRYAQPNGAETETLVVPEDIGAPAAPAGGASSHGACSMGCGDGGYYCGQVPCGSCDSCDSCYGPPVGACSVAACYGRWQVTLAGLVMSRDRPNKLWTTFQTGVNENQLTFPPGSDWSGGGEIRVARYLGCDCCCKVEAVYWILDDMTGERVYNAAENGFASVSTPLNVSLPNVSFLSDGTRLDALFDDAAEHRISRTSNFQNVELNLWCGSGCRGRMSGSWLAGVRFLQFRENLLFGSVDSGFAFGEDLSREAYISADVENNLIGVQIGGRGEYCIKGGLSAFVAPNVGLYGNHISQESSIFRGTGEIATNTDSTTELVFNSSKNDVAMIGQIDLGLNYTHCNWRVFGGYRAIALAGVALADEQVPQFVGDAPEWLDIDSNGHVLLHGAFAGAEYRF